MNVELLSRYDDAELERRLRQITLLNSPVRPYERADIRILTVPADFLFPAAFYVAQAHLERQRELRTALLKSGVDTLNLSGGVEFRVGDEIWAAIPPVVEFQLERVEHHPAGSGGIRHPPLEIEFPLINDGLHRVYLARELGISVRVVAVRGVSPETPYYAYPSSWSQVKLVEKVPEDKNLRKRHRIENYYSLYRDFGPLGVGKPRHPGEVRK
jgi:hypothetical protein